MLGLGCEVLVDAGFRECGVLVSDGFEVWEGLC